MYIGNRVFVSVELDKDFQVLQPGFAMKIYDMKICEADTCRNQQAIIMVLHYMHMRTN